MSPKNIITNGDQVIFTPAFGPALVSVKPGRIAANGLSKVNGKSICREGDERSVSVSGCAYTSGSFTISGIGVIKIQALSPGQLSAGSKSERKKIILTGGQFNAVFEVQSPAQQPVPGSA
ncbi:MAG: hypothetical protein WBA74_19075, partial [Cyclobacteriaceae bacterium]